MVDINIVIEGGVLPDSNIAADTFDNSEKFRESFHVLLSNICSPTKFNLEIVTGAGYKQAVKSFKRIRQSNNGILLVDLDGPKSEKVNRLTELDLNECAESVYFMVQEMEAWILSQPECIIETYSGRLLSKGNLKEDSVFTLVPEEISRPAYWLGVILGRYYSYSKGGIMKKKKYGKLKDAPQLLVNLDIGKLVANFEDMTRLNRDMQML